MLTGERSWVFARPPVIAGEAAVVGPDEGDGPLGDAFDLVHKDRLTGQKSWEQAETAMLEDAAEIAIENAGLRKEEIRFFIGGDLLNQITSTSFAARTLGMAYFGVFGACSTSMESLALGAQLIDSGATDTVLTAASSHNCTAEKQFRYPTEYGSQKPPSAQYTVTGSGAAVLTPEGDGPLVTSATIGRIVDRGLKDPFNMGAAMAPAAVDTIKRHFLDLGREPADYDLIVTGDLSKIGKSLALDLFEQEHIPIHETHYDDCGVMIYDPDRQNVQAGGSGCACSAVVTYGHLIRKMRAGDYRRILVVATGSLHSPLTILQGETIPCIAHAVCIESGI